MPFLKDSNSAAILKGFKGNNTTPFKTVIKGVTEKENIDNEKFDLFSKKQVHDFLGNVMEQNAGIAKELQKGVVDTVKKDISNLIPIQLKLANSNVVTAFIAPKGSCIEILKAVNPVNKDTEDFPDEEFEEETSEEFSEEDVLDFINSVSPTEDELVGEFGDGIMDYIKTLQDEGKISVDEDGVFSAEIGGEDSDEGGEDNNEGDNDDNGEGDEEGSEGDDNFNEEGEDGTGEEGNSDEFGEGEDNNNEDIPGLKGEEISLEEGEETSENNQEEDNSLNGDEGEEGNVEDDQNPLNGDDNNEGDENNEEDENDNTLNEEDEENNVGDEGSGDDSGENADGLTNDEDKQSPFNLDGEENNEENGDPSSLNSEEGEENSNLNPDEGGEGEGETYTPEELEKFAKETATATLEKFYKVSNDEDKKNIVKLELQRRGFDVNNLLSDDKNGEGNGKNNLPKTTEEVEELKNWIDSYFQDYDKEDLAKYVKDLILQSPAKRKELKDHYRNFYSMSNGGNKVMKVDEKDFAEWLEDQYLVNFSFGDLKDYALRLLSKNPKEINKLKSAYTELQQNNML